MMIVDVVNKLNELVKDNFIMKITVINSTDFLLSFSFYRNEQLLVSLNHNNPFVSLVKKREDITTITGNLNEQLKQRIKNTYVDNISIVNEDKIIQFKLNYSDDFNVKHHYFLIIELIPHHPNLLILDENNIIVFATHYTDLSSSRPILRNNKYVLPEKCDNYDYKYKKIEPESYLDDALTKKDLSQYHSLIKYLEKEIKKCIRKEEVLKKEKEDNQNYELYKEQGDYILTYSYDEDELNNYLKENNVEYDTNLSISDNANKKYKLYRKKKTTIAHDEEELVKNKNRLKQLKDDYEIIKSLDIYKINELQLRYPKFIKKTKITINPKYPFYTFIDGVKYAFGRNAMQNDYLTFRLAEEKHYFFHIKDYAGAHVILMKDNPTEKEIIRAAQIAIYVSKKDIGEVNYAKVSSIKKGHKAGEVILSSYSSTVIKSIEDEIKNAVRKASRFI